MIGDHLVTLVPEGSAEVDLTCLVDQVSIRHGRDDTDSQPEAASATLDLETVADTDQVLPATMEIGSGVRVTTELASGAYVRFVGTITDINMQWVDVAEHTPDKAQVQVIAVSTLADLGRRLVGDVPFPQELDGARVARIMALADVSLDPAWSDPGTVQVLPRDVDSQPALAIAQTIAQTGTGVLWHTRTGEVRYADAEHRRGTVPALELDACDLLVSPTWRRSTEGLLNLVSLGYGPVPEGGEQPRFVDSRPDSVARYGRYELSAATELAAAADAQAMGLMLLTRNSSPVWVMSELPIDVKNLDAAQTQALLGLDMHTLMDLTGLPVAGSAPTSAALWVEGWEERLAWGEHEITLTVSGYCRTVPAPRWDDVNPAWTWDTVDPASLTWDQATCMGPLPKFGRWSDVPASTRWDTVPPGTTWNTWK